MSTMSIHLLTISLSPYLRNHLVITISLSQSCRHNLTISPSRLLPLSVTILPSPSRRYHLAVTTFHRPLTFSAIWQTRMSLSDGEETKVEEGEEEGEGNTKPRVRSAPVGSDNNEADMLVRMIRQRTLLSYHWIMNMEITCREPHQICICIWWSWWWYFFLFNTSCTAHLQRFHQPLYSFHECMVI